MVNIEDIQNGAVLLMCGTWGDAEVVVSNVVRGKIIIDFTLTLLEPWKPKVYTGRRYEKGYSWRVTLRGNLVGFYLLRQSPCTTADSIFV